MIEERFTNSKRFIFCRSEFTGNMQIVDTLNRFESVDLSDELSEVLSQILWEHTQFINEKEKGLFDLNNLRDFIKENSDLDVELLVTLINRSCKND